LNLPTDTKDYPAIILSSVALMTDDEKEMLDKYTSCGGVVIVCGPSALGCCNSKWVLPTKPHIEEPNDFFSTIANGVWHKSADWITKTSLEESSEPNQWTEVADRVYYNPHRISDGKISDSQGRLINFENTVIIMTTNAGATVTSSQAGFGTSEADVAKERTEKALSTFLRPEFINRIDEIITFRSLDEEDFKRIARIMLSDLKDALAERNITFKFTEEVCDFVAEKSFSRKFGARNMRRFIQTEIEDKLAEAMIFVIKGNISMAAVSIKDNEIKVDCI
jgi:hypothetical protein